MLAVPDLFLDNATTLPKTYREVIFDLGRLQPGSSSELQFQTEVLELKRLYRFRRAYQVSDYLNQYRILVPYLFQIHELIRCYFPGNTATVELEQDPEYDRSQLVICIQTQWEPPLALESLKNLDQSGWLKSPNRVHDHILINVEFI